MTKPSVFQLIDLDRTLFDTSAFAKAITDEVNKTHSGLGTELDTRFEAAYLREETFFLLRYLRQEQGNEWFEALAERVLEAYGREAFVLPGAKERLAFAETLNETKPAWGILTFGDEVDQRMKLRIMGLENAAVCLTDTPDKGEVIQAWRTHDGRFQLPESLGGGVVDRLTLEDDKLRAFSNLPEGALGVWVKDLSKEAAHSAALPKNVVHVANLFESMDYFKAHIAAL